MLKNQINVLIIAPAFPPKVNGLGDYSVTLGGSLKLIPNTNITITYGGLRQKEVVTVQPYEEINEMEGLLKIIESKSITTIFLNYSNYGYQKKGVPFWLLNQIKRIKDKNVKLIVFFHELNATSYKPWQTVFWLKPLQRFIFKSLYQAANKCYCSNERIFNILIENSSDKGSKLKKLGIFSNIPEPKHLSLFSERNNTAVVFGSYGRRKAIYQKTKDLKQFINDYKITELIDIGAGDFPGLDQELNIIFNKKGILDTNAIAEILANSKWGLIDYPDSLIGKSGIFAAYAAFGIAIYNLNTHKEQALENLVAGKDYLSSNNYINNFNTEAASGFIRAWYEMRNLNYHTAQIALDLSDKL